MRMFEEFEEAEKFYHIRWKQPDKDGHRRTDILTEKQYSEFMKDGNYAKNIELLKVCGGYDKSAVLSEKEREKIKRKSRPFDMAFA